MSPYNLINYRTVQVFYIIKQYNAMNKSRCSNKLLETAANWKNALLTFLLLSSFNAIHLTYVRRSMYTVSNKKEITNL